MHVTTSSEASTGTVEIQITEQVSLENKKISTNSVKRNFSTILPVYF